MTPPTVILHLQVSVTARIRLLVPFPIYPISCDLRLHGDWGRNKRHHFTCYIDHVEYHLFNRCSHEGLLQRDIMNSFNPHALIKNRIVIQGYHMFELSFQRRGVHFFSTALIRAARRSISRTRLAKSKIKNDHEVA